ncbi:hypothetical protein [Candidatus Microthrix parvicella]|uniref:hypothetical protein n=1 Tax=Candidatus Neomicrothrix parvicella TaxID=41950 RepID=UPI0004AED5EC|nr:hypothetical protein [Candidatus Microthrix parvicella]
MAQHPQSGPYQLAHDIEVALAPSLVVELDRRWPPVGLRRQVMPAEPIEARFGLSDEWMIVPDVEASGDSPTSAAWDLLESELTLFSVRRLTRLVPVHAAAISNKGNVLMVPAPSEGGKSTLAIAAASAGATVLSDEYTLIDPQTGCVEGWRRPVRRRRPDGSTERLDLARPTGPLPVGLIAAVSYDPGSEGEWNELSPAEATAEVLSQTICARSRPDDALDAVLLITRAARAIGGTRPDADTAIARLFAIMDGHD